MPEWMGRAACRDTDPELFFPIGTTGPAAAQIDDAKTICRSCPVAEPCRDHAHAIGTRDGIWGGLTETERANLRRRLQRARHRA
ncbi:WhiB family transcriptional regulator [Spongiactinospora gelatinilytica]|uniref:Transcriptional regulator WhiB n=1 Tax=Spongiactinospora gelatinilytica TaxID=2666298 RepID=A0A2W2HVU8_9ACTN|nr:WhiB family transcriptional regulator [Spongiactinospora gelatinilytica]PZG55655.1 WhiB family transcriptional regulator [Spongiactinospora gelatinilytica]